MEAELKMREERRLGLELGLNIESGTGDEDDEDDVDACGSSDGGSKVRLRGRRKGYGREERADERGNK